MLSARQQRETLAAIVAAVESDDSEDLEQLLANQAQVLADCLHLTPAVLRAFCSMATVPRRARLDTLLRRIKERDHAANARATASLATAAATQLASTARWQDELVELDPGVVLGRELRADRSRKFIEFLAEGFAPVAVRREKLVDTAKALRSFAVTCRLEPRGLCFSWRAGKGGLRLVAQNVDVLSRQAVLPVVLARPVTPKLEIPTRATIHLLPSFNDVWAQIMQM